MAADLNSIRILIRRLTRSPSPSQLTDQEIDEAVNAFYIFDMPEELRLNALKLTLTFFTKPFVDVYPTNSTPGLEDFLNNYISVEQPVYIAGRLSYFSQSREEFFNLYPIVSYRPIVAVGDGINQTFSGFLSNIPAVQNSISFCSIGNPPGALALVAKDRPDTLTNSTGELIDEFNNILGEINYLTGEYSFTYAMPPGPNAPIEAQYLPYRATLPTAMLFYGNEFTFRPIPNLPYKVTMNAFVRPTAFDGSAFMTPFLEEWWQYLAYGGAKKIFEWRAEPDSVELIMTEFIRQQDLILRRTLVQNASRIPATIYNCPQFNGLGWNNSSGGNL